MLIHGGAYFIFEILLYVSSLANSSVNETSVIPRLSVLSVVVLCNYVIMQVCLIFSSNIYTFLCCNKALHNK